MTYGIDLLNVLLTEAETHVKRLHNIMSQTTSLPDWQKMARQYQYYWDQYDACSSAIAKHYNDLHGFIPTYLNFNILLTN